MCVWVVWVCVCARARVCKHLYISLRALEGNVCWNYNDLFSLSQVSRGHAHVRVYVYNVCVRACVCVCVCARARACACVHACE